MRKLVTLLMSLMATSSVGVPLSNLKTAHSDQNVTVHPKKLTQKKISTNEKMIQIQPEMFQNTLLFSTSGLDNIYKNREEYKFKYLSLKNDNYKIYNQNEENSLHGTNANDEALFAANYAEMDFDIDPTLTFIGMPVISNKSSYIHVHFDEGQVRTTVKGRTLLFSKDANLHIGLDFEFTIVRNKNTMQDLKKGRLFHVVVKKLDVTFGRIIDFDDLLHTAYTRIESSWRQIFAFAFFAKNLTMWVPESGQYQPDYKKGDTQQEDVWADLSSQLKLMHGMTPLTALGNTLDFYERKNELFSHLSQDAWELFTALDVFWNQDTSKVNIKLLQLPNAFQSENFQKAIDTEEEKPVIVGNIRTIDKGSYIREAFGINYMSETSQEENIYLPMNFKGHEKLIQALLNGGDGDRFSIDFDLRQNADFDMARSKREDESFYGDTSNVKTIITTMTLFDNKTGNEKQLKVHNLELDSYTMSYNTLFDGSPTEKPEGFTDLKEGESQVTIINPEKVTGEQEILVPNPWCLSVQSVDDEIKPFIGQNNNILYYLRIPRWINLDNLVIKSLDDPNKTNIPYGYMSDEAIYLNEELSGKYEISARNAKSIQVEFVGNQYKEVQFSEEQQLHIGEWIKLNLPAPSFYKYKNELSNPDENLETMVVDDTVYVRARKTGKYKIDIESKRFHNLFSMPLDVSLGKKHPTFNYNLHDLIRNGSADINITNFCLLTDVVVKNLSENYDVSLNNGVISVKPHDIHNINTDLPIKFSITADGITYAFDTSQDYSQYIDNTDYDLPEDLRNDNNRDNNQGENENNNSNDDNDDNNNNNNGANDHSDTPSEAADSNIVVNNSDTLPWIIATSTITAFAISWFIASLIKMKKMKFLLVSEKIDD